MGVNYSRVINQIFNDECVGDQQVKRIIIEFSGKNPELITVNTENHGYLFKLDHGRLQRV